jgi:hypothetical protein
MTSNQCLRDRQTASHQRARSPRAERVWTVPLQRVRRALAESTRWIDTVRRVVYAAEHGDLRSRRRAGLRMIDVPRMMDKAAAELGIAAGALALVGAVVKSRVRLGVRQASDRAANALLKETEEFLAVGERLTELSDGLEERFKRLNESFEALAEEAARRRAEADARAAVPQPEPSALRRFLTDYLAMAALRLSLLRRRRTRTERLADAPRRISRGRAPPFASACSL